MRDMTAAQRLQCRRFLAELRRTGNVKISADRVGVPQQTWQRRRRTHPAFATEWAAALGFARATLAKSGPQPQRTDGPKTVGGEYTVRKGNSGELQVRRAHPGELTEQGETLFLQTLAATCNIRLASDAVGIGAPAMHVRRARSDHFADRMDAALAQGHERLEFALMESALHSLAPDEMARGWAELGAEPPSPLTVMTFDQVIISMGMHMKRAVLGEKRRARNARVSTVEETDAAITKLLDNLHKRKVAMEKCDWETGKARVVEADSGRAVRIAPPDECSSAREPARASVRVRLLE